MIDDIIIKKPYAEKFECFIGNIQARAVTLLRGV